MYKTFINRYIYPILVCSKMESKTQTRVATITLTTSLSRESKGINMSRLTEQLELYRQKGH
ncbi:GTP cyclohydrolase, FolE2/MptA family [Paenibacillus sp. BJ-4]|uniref:GTP cyclohydrolase, FolE2/MptA family n=1 Tax=Paenibacillus sp. BJ-4 TaxID=2878097 RepID=UPI00298FFA62|nr:GTP cyclohydrolase, FolE2/MptA family [Paenibacillus sp. BJ-4]